MKTRAWDYTIGALAVAAFVLLLVENTPFGAGHQGFFRTANLAVLLAFAADVTLRLAASRGRLAYLKRKWFDLIVFVPLIQFVPRVGGPQVFVIVRQLAIVTMLVSRSRRAGRLLDLLSLRPAQAMIVGFLGAIGIGSVLLMLPAANAAGERLSLVDAVFTATSAVCVTGLIVRDTATQFTPFGQLVILGLIQAGGLGIMTFSVALVVFTGRPIDVRRRAALQDALDHDTLAGVRGLIRFIVLMTVAFEAAGAVLLFAIWRGPLGSARAAAYHAFFHSVSAFCNAGFSTFSDSLVRFRASGATNAVVCGLIVMGGVGFMVIRDLWREGGERLRPPGAASRRARVQTRIVWRMSILLIAAGALVVYLIERGGLFASLSTRDAVLAALFQSVTARTAGFNTVDIGRLAPASLLVTIALMFIGASPGSTGGGVKTTTVAVLWASVVAALRNRERTELCRRTIPAEVVQKAATVLCLALLIVLGFAIALLSVEEGPFLDILFETVSAFGTVGLSTGITPRLSVSGRTLITVLMFIGRLGPLTVAYALVRSRSPARYEYAAERVMIG